MVSGKVIVFMGSKSDYSFASRIAKFFRDEEFDIKCEYVIASAHRAPKRLLEAIAKCEVESQNFPIVVLTVAGLSDALSGVVAGSTRHPVIACPPDIDRYGWAKFFSSTITPLGVAVALVPRPENAALSAAKILALQNKVLQKKIVSFMKKLEKMSSETSIPTNT